jgi:hypothetical protein
LTPYYHSYTLGIMKTAISVPNAVFSRAEVFARRRNMTRSALFAVAVEEYVQHHRAEDVTRRLNEIYAKEDSALDPVLERLQTISLPKEAW